MARNPTRSRGDPSASLSPGRSTPRPVLASWCWGRRRLWPPRSPAPPAAEPEATPTRAGGAPACGGERAPLAGALEEPVAEDGREGSGRQRVKIRDATAARGGAGRDACRGETPAPSPGAKTPSATTAHHAAGRDACRCETPSPSPGAKIPSATTAHHAAGRDARRGKTPSPSPNAKILSAAAAHHAAGRDALYPRTPARSPNAKIPSATSARGSAGRDAPSQDARPSPSANIPSAPTPHPWSLRTPSAPPLPSCRPPSPNPHNQRVGRPRERGERVILAGAQEESVARDAREDSGCAVSQNP